MDRKTVTLLVMAPGGRAGLVEHLEGCGADVLQAADCEQARQMLRTQPRVQIVLTDVTLSDGTWRTVLEEVGRSRREVPTIVCTRLADDGLWLSVLAQGVYDLLVEPYQREEVQRIVTAAKGARSEVLAGCVAGSRYEDSGSAGNGG